MGKVVLLNCLMNIIFTAIFVYLNTWALQNNFEETFVSLAVIYGVVVVGGNVLYISAFCRK